MVKLNDKVQGYGKKSTTVQPQPQGGHWNRGGTMWYRFIGTLTESNCGRPPLTIRIPIISSFSHHRGGKRAVYFSWAFWTKAHGLVPSWCLALTAVDPRQWEEAFTDTQAVNDSVGEAAARYRRARRLEASPTLPHSSHG
ncbi:hypothetical protein EYF80_020742 [Liparis tanakae]|uniref:Uncharacterized protein n=1 Tax=Liparis tanakae TaxID=230148 RepID=A0A4Z2HTA8_9TELE|nr:hypothetical protein EYF80_020742 [Liparis tanakae]